MVRYVVLFSAIQLTLIVVGVTATLAFDWDSPRALAIVITLFATTVTSMIFVKKHARLPTHQERRALTWWSFCALLGMTAVLACGFLAYLALRFGVSDVMLGLAEFSQALPAFPALVWLLIVAFAIAMTYVTLWFGYGFLTTRFGKTMLAARGR